ncbi:hypothetical protein EYF80_023095 [Liparis tanakae]|uniref:Uncharacterized protein n=1 Tax=Liparis tanakae TaxID=230148 RepID=A0A4Z2HLK3_9TELE|nr:hypothetical protein EYF80_023095 [Liparis tanakae]
MSEPAPGPVKVQHRSTSDMSFPAELLGELALMTLILSSSFANEQNFSSGLEGERQSTLGRCGRERAGGVRDGESGEAASNHSPQRAEMRE